MENTLAVIFIVLSLLVGAISGVVLAPADTIEIEVPGETVYQNVTVEKIVEVAAPNQLDLAVDAFMQAIEDEEVNDMDYRLKTFDFNEIEISKDAGSKQAFSLPLYLILIDFMQICMKKNI